MAELDYAALDKAEAVDPMAEPDMMDPEMADDPDEGSEEPLTAEQKVLAKEAGMSPEQARAMKRFVMSCSYPEE
jgi:hypothetical protein